MRNAHTHNWPRLALLTAVTAVLALAVSAPASAVAADTWFPYWGTGISTPIKAIAADSAKDPCTGQRGQKRAYAVALDDSPLVAENTDDPELPTWRTFTPIGAKVNALASTTLCGVPEVFAIGKDNALWTNAAFNRRFYSGELIWNGYSQLARDPITGVAAVASATNRIDVFVINQNRLLTMRRVNGVWTRYTPLAPYAYVKAIAATSPYPGRIDLFAIGQDDAVWTMHSINDVWTNFRQLEPNAVNSITASASFPNRIDLYVMGKDNALWTKHGTNDIWTTYKQLAPNQIKAVAAVAPKYPGGLGGLVIGTDYHLWEKIGYASTP